MTRVARLEELTNFNIEMDFIKDVNYDLKKMTILNDKIDFIIKALTKVGTNNLELCLLLNNKVEIGIARRGSHDITIRGNSADGKIYVYYAYKLGKMVGDNATYSDIVNKVNDYKKIATDRINFLREEV